MPDGGRLGLYCSHAYAHNTSEGINDLPSALKGVDMAVYEVFQALGSHIQLRPVLDEGNTRSLNDTARDEGYYKKGPLPVYLGTKLQPVEECINRSYPDEYASYKESLMSLWFRGRGFKVNRDIKWLGSRREDKLAMTALTYGNEASIETFYSSMAVIVTVAPFEERSVS